MSKHRLSPALLPNSKRIHLAPESGLSQPHSSIRLTFDSALYDELILSIFSHLSWLDLCAAQATSRNWSRLAADNELWRKLYLKVFGRPRLRGARGFIGRTDGREVKSLPGRAKVEDIKDWKWMFRISSNWKKGRCTVEELRLSLQPVTTDLKDTPSRQTHILLAGNITITTAHRGTVSPDLCLRSVTGAEHYISCTSVHGALRTYITTLALDQSMPKSGHMRIASFISSGEFKVFAVNPTQPSASCIKYTYAPVQRTSRVSPIIHAVYHHPLLITLSESFTLSIYDLSTGEVTLTQTLTSFTSYPPTSLVLSAPSAAIYKLVLAYAIPVYPAHWSVGATELIISGPTTRSEVILPSSSSLLAPEYRPMTIVSTRSARTLDIPQGWIDEHKLRSMREQWSRKVSRVADTQTDGKWVVLAPDDISSRYSSSSLSSAQGSLSHAPASSLYSPTSLQLYRLTLPTCSSVSSPAPKLTFIRTLNGQLGPVSALSLSDGRCVSFGLNGSIWVWDLDGGSGTEVAEPELGKTYSTIDRTKRSIAFDERRIVTAVNDRVVERRFDI